VGPNANLVEKGVFKITMGRSQQLKIHSRSQDLCWMKSSTMERATEVGNKMGIKRMENYPSIHFLLPLNPFQGCGGLEPIPAVIGREAGYTLDRSQVHHRATQRQTTIPAHTHS